MRRLVDGPRLNLITAHDDCDPIVAGPDHKYVAVHLAPVAATKAGKDIWGCGQGIAAVKAVVPAGELVARLKREFAAARNRITCHPTRPEGAHP